MSQANSAAQSRRNSFLSRSSSWSPVGSRSASPRAGSDQGSRRQSVISRSSHSSAYDDEQRDDDEWISDGSDGQNESPRGHGANGNGAPKKGAKKAKGKRGRRVASAGPKNTGGKGKKRNVRPVSSVENGRVDRWAPQGQGSARGHGAKASGGSLPTSRLPSRGRPVVVVRRAPRPKPLSEAQKYTRQRILELENERAVWSRKADEYAKQVKTLQGDVRAMERELDTMNKNGHKFQFRQYEEDLRIARDTARRLRVQLMEGERTRKWEHEQHIKYKERYKAVSKKLAEKGYRRATAAEVDRLTSHVARLEAANEKLKDTVAKLSHAKESEVKKSSLQMKHALNEIRCLQEELKEVQRQNRGPGGLARVTSPTVQRGAALGSRSPTNRLLPAQQRVQPNHAVPRQQVGHHMSPSRTPGNVSERLQSVSPPLDRLERSPSPAVDAGASTAAEVPKSAPVAKDGTVSVGAGGTEGATEPAEQDGGKASQATDNGDAVASGKANSAAAYGYVYKPRLKLSPSAAPVEKEQEEAAPEAPLEASAASVQSNRSECEEEQQSEGKEEERNDQDSFDEIEAQVMGRPRRGQHGTEGVSSPEPSSGYDDDGYDEHQQEGQDSRRQRVGNQGTGRSPIERDSDSSVVTSEDEEEGQGAPYQRGAGKGRRGLASMIDSSSDEEEFANRIGQRGGSGFSVEKGGSRAGRRGNVRSRASVQSNYDGDEDAAPMRGGRKGSDSSSHRGPQGKDAPKAPWLESSDEEGEDGNGRGGAIGKGGGGWFAGGKGNGKGGDGKSAAPKPSFLDDSDEDEELIGGGGGGRRGIMGGVAGFRNKFRRGNSGKAASLWD